MKTVTSSSQENTRKTSKQFLFFGVILVRSPCHYYDVKKKTSSAFTSQKMRTHVTMVFAWSDSTVWYLYCAISLFKSWNTTSVCQLARIITLICDFPVWPTLRKPLFASAVVLSNKIKFQNQVKPLLFFYAIYYCNIQCEWAIATRFDLAQGSHQAKRITSKFLVPVLYHCMFNNVLLFSPDETLEQGRNASR